MKEIINAVYSKLKNREINPRGRFDGAGRFYAENADLIDVREPSRAFPYSHMSACRTKKYVAKVVEKFNVKSQEELEKFI